MLRSLKDLERYTVYATDDWAGRISWSESKVYVDLSLQAIKKSPEWNASAAINREYEARLCDYYGRPVYWGSGQRRETKNATI
jgi:hypothetical protein